MSLKRKMKKGFTLVELVVVIAVIAILSAVSVGAYFGITESANSSAAEQGAKQFHTALVTIANDPSYDEGNKYINVKSDGTVEFNYSDTELAQKFEAFSGLKYTFVIDADTDEDDTNGNTAPANPADNTVWMVNGKNTFVYYTNGKAATVKIKTGSIDVA